jgi:hypothetical protein
MNDINEELRWTKEALALVQNHGSFSSEIESYKTLFPVQYTRLLDHSEEWLEEHKERLERDLDSIENPYKK